VDLDLEVPLAKDQDLVDQDLEVLLAKDQDLEVPLVKDQDLEVPPVKDQEKDHQKVDN